MRPSDTFRRKLRRRLLGIAETRRLACANQPSGADLKAIAHCERLAASADALAPQLCTAVTDTMADPARARRFAAIWAELPEALGTTIWPRDAGELTATMVRQSRL